MLINDEITINGPNGMYSSDFLIFVISNKILKIAPIRKDNKVIIIILDNPKNKPKCSH